MIARLGGHWPSMVLLLALCVPAAAQEVASAGPLSHAIDAALARVVKLHGGSLGRQEGYATGVLVSADGQIVTTLSAMLDTPALRAVLPDGRRLPARVLARDQRRQLALLQVEAANLQFFAPGDSTRLRTGDWLIAAANPFRVAAGPEPVSVTAGVFSGRTTLDARRRAQEFEYSGEVLLTDVITATPGTTGGALVDADGRWVGLLGKRVVSRRTNTWLNYAIPVEEVTAFMADASAGRLDEAGQPPTTQAVQVSPVTLGIRLFDVGGRTQLAYVERVRPGSPARAAGVRSGDLILAVDDGPVSTCDEFIASLAAYGPGDEFELLLKRDEALVSARVRVPTED